ncbi:MAG: radical SAM protein [bacterium]
MTIVPLSVEICETFVSLQGESTRSGQPCWFVRLAGCNLRCRYCDSVRAWERGEHRSVAELLDEYRASGIAMAEITGGEPLLQPGFSALAVALRDAGLGPLLVETNGSCDLRLIPAGVIAIMDIKTPDSGESGRFDRGNLQRLRPVDEVKFVIASRADFDWAAALVRAERLETRCAAVLVSPAAGLVEAAGLASWLLESRLPMRMNLQLHRLVGMQ